MRSPKERFLLGVFLLLAAFLIFYWVFHDPVSNFQTEVPGMDHRPVLGASHGDSIIIGEKFKAWDSTFVSSLTGIWPQFRGKDGDNINKESIKLLDHFSASGPRVIWKKDMGEGHAGAAIYKGRVYVMDYDERKKNDVLHCYSLTDGKELWRRWYAVNIKRNHGMSRTIPAVNDQYVVTMGPRCQVMCCDALHGTFLWGIDLPNVYKTAVPLWYTGQCPIIDNNIAVIAVGGTSLMIGVNCADGKVVWKTPNPDSLKMSHSSVVPMNLAGKRTYVYNSLGGLAGVSAEDTDRGSLLWHTRDFNPSVIAPSPLQVGENKIFVTAGYGAGAAVIRINRTGIEFRPETLVKYKPSQGVASEQQTPVFTQGKVFNIQTKDAGDSRNQFVCADPRDFRKILWTSSKTDRYGLGPYLLADGKFYLLSDEGELTIVRFSTTEFKILDRKKVLEGPDAWGPMALADGYLVLRDSKHMICIDLKTH